MAGPAVLLSYAVGGFIAFLIMRQLGEMMAQEPVAGSFSNLAHKYWGDFPGLLSGWNYWILYVLVGMSELTAVAVYVQYWFPQVEPWQTTAFSSCASMPSIWPRWAFLAKWSFGLRSLRWWPLC